MIVMKKEDKKLKYKFYLMSLWLLFVLIFVLTVDIPISFSPDAKFIGVGPLLKRNWLAFCSLLLAGLGGFFAVKVRREWKGVTNPPYEIATIENVNYEYLAFLTTYIIPLVCIDLSNIRYVIVLAVLLVIMGFLFVRMNLYYGNPILALMGYRLYRVQIKELDNPPDGIILISEDELAVNTSINWIPIDKYVWVVKETKNER